MSLEVYRRIISLIRQAADIAQSIGIYNILQPGLVKEMIIADLLGHHLIHSKRDADAYSPENPNEKYEYLSCKEGGSGQLDRMFARPPEKKNESLKRITRNQKIYIAIFYASNQTRCKIIYEIEPKVLLKEAERQLEVSTNDISHLSFSPKWAEENGKIVYHDSE